MSLGCMRSIHNPFYLRFDWVTKVRLRADTRRLHEEHKEEERERIHIECCMLKIGRVKDTKAPLCGA